MLKRSYVFALVLCALAAAPCSADIYGFVDENGQIHLSDVRQDSRYQLYMKTKPRPEQVAAQQAAAEPAPAAAADVAAFERPLPLKGRKHYDAMINKVAAEQQVDAALLHAVITVESAYNSEARSPKGATGLMQIMPDTGKRYGATNLLDPLDNLRAGARYLRDLLGMFNNNMRLAVAAYNAGEGAVLRFGRAVPPYPETRAYVPRVMQHYQRYRAQSRI